MSELPGSDLRVPVLAPTGRDADLACRVLRGRGLRPVACADLPGLLREVAGAACGPVVLADEALTVAGVAELVQVLDRQPDWSDLPLILLLRPRRSRQGLTPLLARRSCTVLPRPLAVASFQAVVVAAAEARRRQLQVRNLLDSLRTLNERLEQRAEQLRRLALEVTEAEHRERRRISRLLHDHLQQLIVGAKYQLSLAGARPAESLGGVLEQVEDLLNESLEVSRSLATELSPPVLQDAGLGESLSWLARRFANEQGLAVDLRTDPDVAPVPERLKLALFEAVSELLFNVVKHAGVGRATLELRRNGRDGLKLAVEDAGAGFAGPDRRRPGIAGGGAGLGLFRLRERLAHLGVRVIVRSEPGRGTRVEMRVPGGLLASAADGERERDRLSRQLRPPAGAPEAGSGRPERGIRIVLADDHEVVRQGLRMLLEGESDLRVVGEAADGQEAVELCRRLRPDVVIMDISMPRLDGLAATRIIRDEGCCGTVLGLSMHEAGDVGDRMLAAGAVAHLPKNAAAERLVGAIRAAAGPRVRGRDREAG